MKFFLYLIAFFYSVFTVFAPSGVLTGLLGQQFENFISNFVLNKNILAFFFFAAMLLGTFALFKGMLRFVFKAQGNNMHNKEINTIAFMFSLIGTGGLFYMIAGDSKNIDNLVLLLGGTFGLVIFTMIGGLVMNIFYNWSKSFEKGNGMGKFILILGIAVTSGFLLSYIVFLVDRLVNPPSWMAILQGIISDIFFLSIFAAIIFGIILLFSIKGGIDSIREKEEDKNPGIGELRESLGLINNEVNKLDEYFNANRLFLNNVNKRNP